MCCYFKCCCSRHIGSSVNAMLRLHLVVMYHLAGLNDLIFMQALLLKGLLSAVNFDQAIDMLAFFTPLVCKPDPLLSRGGKGMLIRRSVKRMRHGVNPRRGGLPDAPGYLNVEKRTKVFAVLRFAAGKCL